MYNPYVNPYLYQQQNILPQISQNILPPQQILQAKGKASIDMIKMSPDSSVLIADETAPIVWKCMSDSLGNVTAIPYDIQLHKDEEQKIQENLSVIVTEMEERLKRLEDGYKSFIEKSKSTNEEYRSDKTDVADVKRQSSGNKQNDRK